MALVRLQRSMSSKSGYSALDIHCIQRNIPNEVRKEEIDVSQAIKELLFSHAVSLSRKRDNYWWYCFQLS
eukprot:scaffold3666_cov268-Chaetoceros_neogracile.AAC.1